MITVPSSIINEVIENEAINGKTLLMFGETILMFSIIVNMKEITLELLKKEDINYNTVNSDGKTALILACK